MPATRIGAKATCHDLDIPIRFSQAANPAAYWQSIRRDHAADLALRWARPGIVVVATACVGARLLLSHAQYVQADLQPFSRHLLDACALPYENIGLGRENPAASPSLCAFGLAAAILGGPVAQHLFLVATMCTAGISMLFLLRRLGNPWWLSVAGGLLYEFSPPMLNQIDDGGPGILFTGALLPIILISTIPSTRYSAARRGAICGAVLALSTYVNIQAPALAAFLLVPAVAANTLSVRSREQGAHSAPAKLSSVAESPDQSSITSMAKYVVAAAVAFGLGILPLLQSLPAQVQGASTASGSVSADLVSRLAQSQGALDFFVPFLFVGAVPAFAGIVWLSRRRDAHPVELAAAFSFAILIVFWEVFARNGVQIVRAVPLIGLFKDFIKLQIVMGVPLTVLSVMVVRWTVAQWSGSASQVVRLPLASIFAMLLLIPQGAVVSPDILSLRFGLAPSQEVPNGFVQTVTRLHSIDTNAANYRVLWLPMDFRVFRSFESLEPSVLLYREDSSAAAKQAVLDTYLAIVGRKGIVIATMLATEGVKYVVLDKVDGQLPGASWQTGSMNVVSVYGTYLLTGQESEYENVLDNSPGLSRLSSQGGYVIYRNLLWESIESSYSGILNPAPGFLSTAMADPLAAASLRLALRKELPSILFEPYGDLTGDRSLDRRAIFTLTAVDTNGADHSRNVRLITDADVVQMGDWTSSEPGEPLGFAQFKEQGTGFLSLRQPVLEGLVEGTRLIWIEVKRNDVDNGLDGVTHSVAVDPVSGPHVACTSPGCTVSYMLLVPPLSTAAPVTRYAAAYSPLLRSPDNGHSPPIRIGGDWASIFQPSVHGTPSAIYDPTSWWRWAALGFGYLFVLTFCLAAFMPDLDRCRSERPRSGPMNPNSIDGSASIDSGSAAMLT
jgi:hypothetical protein